LDSEAHHGSAFWSTSAGVAVTASIIAFIVRACAAPPAHGHDKYDTAAGAEKAALCGP
jgi:hypothetical protein